MASGFCAPCQSLFVSLAESIAPCFAELAPGRPNTDMLEAAEDQRKVRHVWATHRSCWLCALLWLDWRLHGQRRSQEPGTPLQESDTRNADLEGIRFSISPSGSGPGELILCVDQRVLFFLSVHASLDHLDVHHKRDVLHCRLELATPDNDPTCPTSKPSIEFSKSDDHDHDDDDDYDNDDNDDNNDDYDDYDDHHVSRPGGEARANNAPARKILGRIQQQISECEASHETCKAVLPSHQTYRPTRLLSLERTPGFIRLCESRQLPENEVIRYATLSHCWGSGRADKLLLANRGQMMSSIAVAQLNRTNREAVELCSSLGIAYLWIDSLCIIQDDVEARDWQREASDMHKVYGNSCLNIAATVARSGEDGLFRRLNPMLGYGMVFSVTKPDFVMTADLGGLPDQFELQMLASPLLRRGWVHQELSLAARILYVSEGQAFFACRHTVRAFPKHGEFCSQRKFSLGRPLGLDVWTSRSALEKAWAASAQDYSRTDVSVADDRYTALSGLAALFQEKFREAGVQTSLIAGCWTHNIAAWLLWRPVEPESMRRMQLATHVPSWSWLSCGHALLCGAIDQCANEISGLSSEIVNVRVVPKYANLLHGPLLLGVISIRIPILCLKPDSYTHSSSLWPDHRIGRGKQFDTENSVRLRSSSWAWDSVPLQDHKRSRRCALMRASAGDLRILILEECSSQASVSTARFRRCGLVTIYLSKCFVDDSSGEHPRKREFETAWNEAQQKILDFLDPQKLEWDVIDLV